ncbi:histidine phosphatase family protein [Enterococcus cecorum]|uniref:histidine phosphatase family protein n=1 Tax=Enterococcus cecorum TaxID=44008 RepID=UPI00200B2719|nr:histidine phosphatase family protein [Enterococcus cecorum]
MAKTQLYIVRHGKTMFNTLQRVQGWCDTPLTAVGVHGIEGTGIGIQDIDFVEAVSSDSGRAIQTMRILLSKHKNGANIPYHTDPRIREWNFGSLEGGYDAEMWGVLPRVLNYRTYDELIANQVSYKEICEAIYEADTANWAETYDELKNRVLTGFEDVAYRVEKQGGGKALIVSHGLTIAFLMHLVDESNGLRIDIDNGSISILNYENGRFSIETIGDKSFKENGLAKLSEKTE